MSLTKPLKVHDDGLIEGQEKLPGLTEKSCEAVGCIRTFTPAWHSERRCSDCRKAKKPYKL